jgi:hypothetical protein
MADATADWTATLAAMSYAFLEGDNRRGEELLSFALDGGAPWDVATATVARALSARRGGGRVTTAAVPAPA